MVAADKDAAIKPARGSQRKKFHPDGAKVEANRRLPASLSIAPNQPRVIGGGEDDRPRRQTIDLKLP
jgi:hypothetical protein